MLTNVKLGKNMRSVSIVGVGATPFFNGIENPAYKGLTNGELFGYAALDACGARAPFPIPRAAVPVISGWKKRYLQWQAELMTLCSADAASRVRECRMEIPRII